MPLTPEQRLDSLLDRIAHLLSVCERNDSAAVLPGYVSTETIRSVFRPEHVEHPSAVKSLQ